MTEPAPIVFLDIDDVLCLDLEGRLWVETAVAGRLPDPEPMYGRLFSADAKAALAQIDAACHSRLRYVVSSLWRLVFDRAQMTSIFEAAGLPFVAQRLEAGDRWRTPHLLGEGRAAEVALWLQRHHRGEAYAVVDDRFSGLDLIEAVARAEPYVVDRLAICEEGVGLLEQHVPELVAALQQPGVCR